MASEPSKAARAVVVALVITTHVWISHAQIQGGGQVLAWGSTGQGEGLVPLAAQPAIGMSAVAAGAFHSLALTPTGQVIAWGLDSAGQSTVPQDAMSDYVVTVAAGSHHSLALTRTGRVIAWGDGSLNQTRLPAELGLFSVTAISAGEGHSLALTSTGRVIAWGSSMDRSGTTTAQATVPKEAMANITVVSAGRYHSLALTSTGRVLAWGSAKHNQSFVPPEALSGIVAIAAGGEHSLALSGDGRVILWGRNTESQCTVPSEMLSADITAIAGGYYHSLALTNTGRVVVWGDNTQNQTTVPPQALGGVTRISAGGSHSLAILGHAGHVCVANEGWDWAMYGSLYADFSTPSRGLCCDLCFADPKCYGWAHGRGRCDFYPADAAGPGLWTARLASATTIGTRYGDVIRTAGYTAVPNTYYNCPGSDIMSGLDSHNTCHDDLDCCQSLCNNNTACNWFEFATGQPQCNATTGGCCWPKQGTLCAPTNGTGGATGYTSYLKTTAPAGYYVRPNTRYPCPDDTPAGLAASAIPACHDIHCCRSTCDNDAACILFEFAYGLVFCNGGGGCCWTKSNMTCGGLNTTKQATASPTFISYLKKPVCPHYPGYTPYAGVDGDGVEEQYVGPQNVPTLCDNNCACRGWNSNGWIKSAVTSLYDVDLDRCLYSKDNVTDCGPSPPAMLLPVQLPPLLAPSPFLRGPTDSSVPINHTSSSEDFEDTSSRVNAPMAVGLAVGVGGAALLGLVAAIIIVKRQRKQQPPDVKQQTFTASSIFGLPGISHEPYTISSGADDNPGLVSIAAEDAAAGQPADSSDVTTSNGNSPQPSSLVNTQTAEEINVQAVFLLMAQQMCNAKPHVSLKGLAISPTTPFVVGLALNVDIKQEVTIKRIIGEGGCGVVHRGRYRGADVAIKTLPATDNMYVQELGILGRMRHPNIVSLLGAGVKGKQVYLILELADSSLDKLLYSHTPLFSVVCDHLDPAPNPAPGRLLPLSMVVSVAMQMALGLKYLHPTIIHRDLKPANVLVNKPAGVESLTPVVKLSDFGLARMMASVTLQTGNPAAGTIAYMAPECFNNQHYGLTCKCDIYSFGMCLWELLHGQPPWYRVDPGLVLFRVVIQQARPAFTVSSERCPVALQTLIKICWGADPAGRPTADELVLQLDNMMKTLDKS